MQYLKNLNTMQDFYFPDGVALPIGGMSSSEYIVLEMHYDNPNLHSGQCESIVILLASIKVAN